MNKILLLLVAACIAYGCNKNHNDNPATVTFLGRWYEQKLITKSYLNNTLTHTETQTYDRDTYIEFSNNGTLTSKGSAGIITSFSYSYNEGNRRLVTYVLGDSSESYVTTLTEKQLVLHQEQEVGIGTDSTYKDAYDTYYGR